MIPAVMAGLKLPSRAGELIRSLSALLIVAFSSLYLHAQSPTDARGTQTHSQSADGEAEATKFVNALVNVSRQWFDQKLSTPGATAAVQETSRSTSDGLLVVKYEVHVKGAPKDQTYTYLHWPINAREPVEDLSGLSIAADGLVVRAGRTPEQCGTPDKPDDPVDFTFAPAKGEPFRMALVSADGHSKVMFAVVPDPIVAADKSCSLEIIRLLPRFDAVLIRGKGYKPNETLSFASKSYDERHDWQPKADADGRYDAALMPFVKGKQSGKTDVTLKGENCAPRVSFEWGKQ